MFGTIINMTRNVWWLAGLPAMNVEAGLPHCKCCLNVRQTVSYIYISHHGWLSRALKLCAKSNDMGLLSYKDLHGMVGRAVAGPRQINLQITNSLYKTFTHRCPTRDLVNNNFNIFNTSRQTKFAVNKTNRLRVGYNALSNRLSYINGKVNLDWLHLSFLSFKIKCKSNFL